MRTNNYLWAVLMTATLSLAACGSEEQGITEPQPQEKTATLELRLTGNQVNTRATGDALPTQSDENTVKRYTVAIFNSSGTVNTLQTVTENMTSATTINCTPGENCTGIVVANAPADGHFAGVLNKAEFLKKLIALSDAQTKDCLPMSGEVKDGSNNSTFTLNAGENKGMTAKVDRLVARVSVSSIKTAFDANGQYANASYELKNIFVRNAVEKVVPAVGDYTKTKMGTPTYLTGSYTGTPGTASYLATAVNPSVTISKEGHLTDYWFYIFPNEEATHTALVLEGTFKKNTEDTEGTTIYYPVIINKAQTGTTITKDPDSGAGAGTSNIARNTTYAIKATIKSIGTTDPTGDINPASLELTVSVADWALNITQDVTFE